jgi:hypothetical protein
MQGKTGLAGPAILVMSTGITGSYGAAHVTLASHYRWERAPSCFPQADIVSRFTLKIQIVVRWQVVE